MQNILDIIKEKYEGKYIKLSRYDDPEEFSKNAYQGYVESIKVVNFPHEGDELMIKLKGEPAFYVGFEDTYLEIVDEDESEDMFSKFEGTSLFPNSGVVGSDGNDLSKYHPVNLDEVVQIFDEIKFEDEEKWANMAEDEAVTLVHHGMGRTIRNAFGLWHESPRTNLGQWFVDHGITHPDDMSAIILHAIHRHKNNKAIKDTELISSYRD